MLNNSESPRFHTKLYPPDPPDADASRLTINGAVPFFGFAVHDSINGLVCVTFIPFIVQLVVLLFPWLSVTVTVGWNVPSVLYVCLVLFCVLSVVYPSSKFHEYFM